MKKVILFLLSFFALGTLNLSSVAAVTATSSAYEGLVEGDVITITLKADPTVLTGSNAVAVDLVFEGGEIQEYLEPSGTDWVITTADCDADQTQKFTESRFCSTFLKTDVITGEEDMGQLTVVVTSSNGILISKTTSTKYSDGITEEVSDGDLLDMRLIKPISAEEDGPIVSNIVETDDGDSLVDRLEDNKVVVGILSGVTVLVLLTALLIKVSDKKKETSL